MEEKRYVAIPKTLTDRRTVVTAKIYVENGCGDLDAVQRRDRFTRRFRDDDLSACSPQRVRQVDADQRFVFDNQYRVTRQREGASHVH